MSEVDKARYAAFEEDLTSLLNKHSMENGSDTPDFILAAYLTNQLRTFNNTMADRGAWYYKPSDNKPSQEPAEGQITSTLPTEYEAAVQSARRQLNPHPEDLVIRHSKGQATHTTILDDTGAGASLNEGKP